VSGTKCGVIMSMSARSGTRCKWRSSTEEDEDVGSEGSEDIIFYGRVMTSEVEEARHEQTMPNEERAEPIELYGGFSAQKINPRPT
jgi:hypothetical protein